MNMIHPKSMASDERVSGDLFYGENLMPSPALPAALEPFLCGKWSSTAGEAKAEIIEPFSTKTLATVPIAGDTDLRAAIESAATLAHRGAELPPSERAAALGELAAAIEANADQLAALESQTTGRPIARTLNDDLPLLAAALRHFASLTDLVHQFRSQVQSHDPPVLIAPITSRQPLLACIDALAPAWLCGKPVFFIVEAQAALPILRLAELISKIDVAASLVSILAVANGSAERLAGTSAQLGAMLSTPKPPAFIIRPALVFADCDIDQAVEGIVQQAFTPNLPGEDMGCHVFIEEAAERDFLARLQARLTASRLGDALDMNVELGPLPTREAREAIEHSLAQAQSDGIALARYGQDAQRGENLVTAPALLTAVRPDQLIARRSLAGPALALLTFRTPDEALSKLNPTGAALGATTIWTEKAGKSFAMARRIDSRFIFCNIRDRLIVGLTTGVAALPLAGRKRPLILVENEPHVAIEVTGCEIIDSFAPLSRCKQVMQALGI